MHAQIEVDKINLSYQFVFKQDQRYEQYFSTNVPCLMTMADWY